MLATISYSWCYNYSVLRAFSGFRSEVDENCALLDYYAACSGNFLPTFRDNLSVPSGVKYPIDPLKMGPIGCPATSVRNYRCSVLVPVNCGFGWFPFSYFLLCFGAKVLWSLNTVFLNIPNIHGPENPALPYVVIFFLMLLRLGCLFFSVQGYIFRSS